MKSILFAFIFNKIFNNLIYFFLLILIFASTINHKCFSQDKKEDTDKTKNQISKYIALGWEFSNAEKLDSAVYYATKAKVLSEKTNNIEYYGESCIILAKEYIKTSLYEQALSEIDNAYRAFIKTRNLKGITTVFSYYGIVYYNLTHYNKAIEYHFKALKIAEFSGDLQSCASSLNHIGAVYRYNENYDLSLKYFFKCVEYREKIKDNKGLAITYSNIAALYQLQEKFDSSLFYLSKALEVENIGKDEESAIFNNFANVYLLLNHPDQSIEYSFKALEIQEDIKDNIGKAISQTNIAIALMQKNMVDEAEAWALKGLNTAKQFNIKRLENKIYEILEEIYVKQKNFQLAYEYSKLHKAHKDSVLNNETKKQIEELHIQYETEKKQVEIEKQQYLISNQNLLIKRKNQNIAILIISSLFIISIIIIASIRNKIKQQKHLTQLLLEEEKQKTKLIIEAEDNQKKRIAANLHDSLGQSLVSHKIKIINLLENISFDCPGKITGYLTESVRIIDEVYDEVRTVSHEMLPKALQTTGLCGAIEDLLQTSFSNNSIRHRLNCKLKIEINEKLSVTLFRIMQELLSNILKHSQADYMEVTITEKNQKIIFITEDNGIGVFNTGYKNKTGIGLTNIETRVNSVNGEFEIISEKGKKGSMFIIRIPV